MKVTLVGGGGFRAPMLDRSLGWGAEAIGIDECRLLRHRRGTAPARSPDVLQRDGRGARPRAPAPDHHRPGRRARRDRCRPHRDPRGRQRRHASWTRLVPLALGVLGQETVGPEGSRSRSARSPSCGSSRGVSRPAHRTPGSSTSRTRARSGDRGVAGHPGRPGHRHLRLPISLGRAVARCAWPCHRTPWSSTTQG